MGFVSRECLTKLKSLDIWGIRVSNQLYLEKKLRLEQNKLTTIKSKKSLLSVYYLETKLLKFIKSV